MRLQLLTFVTLTMLFCIGFMTVTSKESGVSLQEIYSNLEGAQESLFNVTSNSITYTNPYTEEFTFNDFVYNTIHGVMYSALVEINTLLGISIKWFYNNVELVQMVFLFKLIIFLAFAWLISTSIVPVGAIYVFYEDLFEKKQKKVNKVVTLILAIITWLIVLGILALIVWGIG